jgi:hypothetical protein
VMAMTPRSSCPACAHWEICRFGHPMRMSGRIGVGEAKKTLVPI